MHFTGMPCCLTCISFVTKKKSTFCRPLCTWNKDSVTHFLCHLVVSFPRYHNVIFPNKRTGQWRLLRTLRQQPVIVYSSRPITVSRMCSVESCVYSSGCPVQEMIMMLVMKMKVVIVVNESQGHGSDLNSRAASYIHTVQRLECWECSVFLRAHCKRKQNERRGGGEEEGRTTISMS